MARFAGALLHELLHRGSNKIRLYREVQRKPQTLQVLLAESTAGLDPS